MQQHTPGGPELVAFDIPDMAVIREIGDALERKNDDLLWAAASRAQSQELFYAQLRSQVGYTTYTASPDRGVRRPRTENHCALVMVPVILPASIARTLLAPHACAETMSAVRHWLEEWFQFRARITLYDCLFPYAEICMWTPSLTRARLEQLVRSTKDSAPVFAPAQDLALPQGAPVLAFIVAAAHTNFGWPGLPPESPTEDLKLQARISGALQLRTSVEQLHERIDVLAPSFSSEAIASGLSTWLSRIAGEHGLRRWDAQQADQDVLVLQLEVGEDAAASAVVPLRAHQLGLDGIEDCVRHVVGLGTSCFTKAQ